MHITVQSLSHIRVFETPMDCSTPGFHVLHHLLEFAQTHVHCVSDAIQPSHPLSSPSPPSLSLSQHQGLFKWVSPLLISFRIDWFDLLAVQGTLISILQHHSSKASISPYPRVFWKWSPWLINLGPWGHKESDTTMWLNWTERQSSGKTFCVQKALNHTKI